MGLYMRPYVFAIKQAGLYFLSIAIQYLTPGINPVLIITMVAFPLHSRILCNILVAFYDFM
jgi:hypothetical protein